MYMGKKTHTNGSLGVNYIDDARTKRERRANPGTHKKSRSYNPSAYCGGGQKMSRKKT